MKEKVNLKFSQFPFDKNTLLFYNNFHYLYKKSMSQSTTIANWLERGQKFLLVGGTHWSIDDTAAMLSLYYVLTKAGKEVTAISPEAVAANISFLPNTKAIGKELTGQNEFVLSISTEKNTVSDMRHRVSDNRVDIIITGDSGPFSPADVQFKTTSQTFDGIITLGVDSLEQCGQIYEKNPQLFADFPVINLSTSLTNEHFGRYQMIDPSKSSTCEIIYDIVSNNNTFKAFLDSTLSTTILTGILSATDSFLSPATTANALRIAGKLQQSGADQSTIVEHLFKEKTFNNLKVLGQLLTNLEVAESHRLAWTSMTESQFESISTTADDIDHWADQLLRHINGSDFFVLMMEQGSDVVVQIRSSLPNPDFQQLADALPYSGDVFAKGINLKLTQQNLNETQTTIRQNLKSYQETRLRLEPDTPFQLAQITIQHPEHKKQVETLSRTSRKAQPKAPDNIPFEAPIKISE